MREEQLDMLIHKLEIAKTTIEQISQERQNALKRKPAIQAVNELGTSADGGILLPT